MAGYEINEVHFYYFEPRIKNVTVWRCTANGTKDDSGAYMQIGATREYCRSWQDTEVSDEVHINNCVIRYRYRQLPSGAYSDWVIILDKDQAEFDAILTGSLLGTLSADESYEVIVGVLDDLGGESNTGVILSSKNVFMHKDGELNSLSIGEVVSEENTVTIAEKLTTKVKGPLNTKDIASEGSISATEQASVGGEDDVVIKPNDITMQKTAFSIHTSNEVGEQSSIGIGNAEAGSAYVACRSTGLYSSDVEAFMSNRYDQTNLRIRLNGGRVFMNGLTAPVDAADATNKEYVDRICIESEDYSGCFYRLVDDEVEWLNPPMLVGVEYRTTERYNGKPVYVQLVSFGALPNTSQSNKNVYYGGGTSGTKIHQGDIVDITGRAYLGYNAPSGSSGEWSAFPFVSGGKAIGADIWYDWTLGIVARTQSDLSGQLAWFTVKYTKTRA